MSCLVISHAEEPTAGLSVSYSIVCQVEEASSLTYIWDANEAVPAQRRTAYPGASPLDQARSGEHRGLSSALT